MATNNFPNSTPGSQKSSIKKMGNAAKRVRHKWARMQVVVEMGRSMRLFSSGFFFWLFVLHAALSVLRQVQQCCMLYAYRAPDPIRDVDEIHTHCQFNYLQEEIVGSTVV